MHCVTPRTVGRLIALLGVLTSPAFAQSPPDGPWSGSIQCQLDVDQSGYARHETQTWTLTSTTPTGKNGDMQIYPAVWTVQGEGNARRAAGQQASDAQWKINVAPQDASLGMFIRASDGTFIIRIWQRPAPARTAAQGTLKRTFSGAGQPPATIASTVYEWALPWIEAKDGATISGKFSAPVEPLSAEFALVGKPTAAADCRWQFTRTASTSNTENTRTLREATAGLKQNRVTNNTAPPPTGTGAAPPQSSTPPQSSAAPTPSASAGFGTVSVSWVAPQADGAIDSYEIETAPEGGVATTATTTMLNTTVNLSACPYPGANCATPHRYRFRVRAHTASGYGDFSPYTSYVRPKVSYVGDNVYAIWSAKNCVMCHTPGRSLDLSGPSSSTFSRVVAANLIANPATASRLVACPSSTGSCATHPGVQGFNAASAEYQALTQWISDGHGQ